MGVRQIATGLLFLVGIAVIIIAIAYFVNIWLFSNVKYITPLEAFFVEGVFLLIFGILLLLGRGGINVWTLKAAILAAAAEAVYGQDTVGPNEAMRRDRWKPQGYTRFALLLLITGFLMLAAYFLGPLLHL